jgi:hypothetical protein
MSVFFFFCSRESSAFYNRQNGGTNSSGSTKTWLRDPNPHGSAFILIGWIRIRIVNADPDPLEEGRKDLQIK